MTEPSMKLGAHIYLGYRGGLSTLEVHEPEWTSFLDISFFLFCSIHGRKIEILSTRMIMTSRNFSQVCKAKKSVGVIETGGPKFKLVTGLEW